MKLAQLLQWAEFQPELNNPKRDRIVGAFVIATCIIGLLLFIVWPR